MKIGSVNVSMTTAVFIFAATFAGLYAYGKVPWFRDFIGDGAGNKIGPGR